MTQIFGALLIVVGLIAIIFGSRTVQSSGVLLGFLRMPSLHAKAVKWAIGLLCIWFGAYMLLTATLP